jgi:hypothetical protein
LLDVGGVSTDDGARVIQWTANGGQNQQWLPQPVGGGYYTLTARHSGKVLDISGVSMDDGAPAIQWTPNGGANQQWLLRSVSGGGPSTADATRLLEQATWGPTPALVQHVQSVVASRGPVRDASVEPSTLPLYPTTHDTLVERIDLPAQQLRVSVQTVLRNVHGADQYDSASPLPFIRSSSSPASTSRNPAG